MYRGEGRDSAQLYATLTQRNNGWKKGFILVVRKVLLKCKNHFDESTCRASESSLVFLSCGTFFKIVKK